MGKPNRIYITAKIHSNTTEMNFSPFSVQYIVTALKIPMHGGEKSVRRKFGWEFVGVD